MHKNYCIMQIWAEYGKSALPICNYSQILYQFLTFTQNLKRSLRHYYENELDQKEPETEFQEWLVELFTKLHNLTGNNFIPKSHYLEYGFQKMGKNFSYPVSEKFTTSDNDESLLSE